MIIKDTDEIVEQLSVNINFSFNAVEPYFANEGTDFIKDVLGTDLYDRLDVAYNADNLSTKLAKLLPLAQRPLIYLGFLQYIPFGNLEIRDGGLVVPGSTTTKAAGQWRVDKLNDQLSKVAFNSLQVLIRFLQANQCDYSWKSTRGYNKYLQFFINYTDDFNHWTNVNIDYETFNRMKASFAYIEKIKILPEICQDLYDQIKLQVKENAYGFQEAYDFGDSPSVSASGSASCVLGPYSNLANNKILVELIKPVVANFATAHALSLNRIDISKLGITVNKIANPERQKDPTEADVFLKAQQQFEDDGNLSLKNLTDYLIANADDFPLFKNSLCFSSTRTVTSDVHVIDEDDKIIFWG